MELDRKKKLKEEYKNHRPEMGLVSYACSANNNIYIGATKDIKSCINGLNLQLDMGFAIHKELQKDWLLYGKESFIITTQELLPYADDHVQGDDYSNELAILLELWRDKMPNAKVILLK